MSDLGEEFEAQLGAALRGDRVGVDYILAVIRPLVLRYCRGRLGRAGRGFTCADDVAQEVCLGVLTALPTYRGQGRPFLAFVYGIAAHKVIDAQRAAGRNRYKPVAEIPEAAENTEGPEQRAMRSHEVTQMRRLLDTLPSRQREIVLLRVVNGLSAEQTAQVIGSTAGAVRLAQHRALTRLRTHVNRDPELVSMYPGRATGPAARSTGPRLQVHAPGDAQRVGGPGATVARPHLALTC